MHQVDPTAVHRLIRSRRSVYPRDYLEKEIPGDILLEILENANWAPTHKRSEPWRFRIFTGESKKILAEYLSEHYRENTSGDLFSEKKFQKMFLKPLQSACVIAICMQKDPLKRLPEWEEIAAVSCAVQNMWLTCSAYGIGAYWSTPSSMTSGPALLNLQKEERCLGLFYMGYWQSPPDTVTRGPVSDKIQWM